MKVNPGVGSPLGIGNQIGPHGAMFSKDTMGDDAEHDLLPSDRLLVLTSALHTSFQ